MSRGIVFHFSLDTCQVVCHNQFMSQPILCHYDNDDTYNVGALCGARPGMLTIAEDRVTCNDCRRILAELDQQLAEQPIEQSSSKDTESGDTGDRA